MGVGEVVRKGWTGEAQVGLTGIMGKIDRCRRELTDWSKNEVGALFEKVKKAQMKMERLRAGSRRRVPLEEETEAKRELNQLLEMEACLW